MPDPIWIDANVAIKASSGNKAYEAELIRLRKAGHHLLMPPAAHQEFMYGNPITEGKGKNPAPVWTERPPPAQRAARLQWLSNMRIYVDRAQDNLTSAQRAANIAVPGADRVSDSDAIVLGQVRSGAAVRNVKNPVLLAADKGVLQNAHVYGVTAKHPVPSVKTAPAAGATTAAPAGNTGAVPSPPPKPGSSSTGSAVKPGAGSTPNPSGPNTSPPGQTTTTPPPAGVPTVPYRTRLASGAKIVGGTVVSVLLTLLATWLKSRLDEFVIRSEIRLLEPDIKKELEKRTEEVAHLQVNGGKAYANVTIGIIQFYGGGVSQGPPKVKLGPIAITGHEVNVLGKTPDPPPMWTLPWMQVTEHTYSFELKVFSDEELDVLASLADLYQVYSRMLRADSTNEHFKQQIKILRDKIVEQFGPKVWVLQV